MLYVGHSAKNLLCIFFKLPISNPRLGSALNLFYRIWRNTDVKTSRAQVGKLAFDPAEATYLLHHRVYYTFLLLQFSFR